MQPHLGLGPNFWLQVLVYTLQIHNIPSGTRPLICISKQSVSTMVADITLAPPSFLHSVLSSIIPATMFDRILPKLYHLSNSLLATCHDWNYKSLPAQKPWCFINMWKASDSMCCHSTHGIGSALLPFFGMFIQRWHSKAVGFWKDWVHIPDFTTVLTFFMPFPFPSLLSFSFFSFLAPFSNPIYYQLQTSHHSLKGPEASDRYHFLYQ